MQYDYISPGLAAVTPDAAFPNMIAGPPRERPWCELQHHWYVDRRVPYIGFLSRDEANLLYNLALPFRGQWALEIGCWLGWSACHLALAGVELDVIDPMLARQDFAGDVQESLAAAGVRERVRLFAGSSPQGVEQLAQASSRQWSFMFIDGDHDAPAPLCDCTVCAAHAAPDAMIVLHDLNLPAVAEGLAYLREQGWNVMLYQTMELMGVAWRGNVSPVKHIPDPRGVWRLPQHLADFPVS